jgi:hypothetical protein
MSNSATGVKAGISQPPSTLIKARSFAHSAGVVTRSAALNNKRLDAACSGSDSVPTEPDERERLSRLCRSA